MMKPNRLTSCNFLRLLIAGVVLPVLTANAFPQNREQRIQYPTSGDPVSKVLLLQIMRAED